MSSLAAARADNFYYPPEWDPKKGGLNKQQGQHPLRERARKLDQGILIIRFEMPFNVWCEGCNHLIGKGVRFNAEKKQIGTYFSSKTWSFVMRSPCCQTRIEVQTDPKNAEYVVVSGARRKVEAFSALDAETLELPGPEDREKYDDPLYKLERDQEDKSKAIFSATQIDRLYERSLATSKNDGALNATLRRRMRSALHSSNEEDLFIEEWGGFRAARKAEKARDQRRESLGLPEAVTLLPENTADREHASLITFGDASAHEKARRLHRQAIKAQSIFATPPARALPATTSSLPQAPGSAPPRASALRVSSSIPAVSSASVLQPPSSSARGAGAPAQLSPVRHPEAPTWMHAPAQEPPQSGATAAPALSRTAANPGAARPPARLQDGSAAGGATSVGGLLTGRQQATGPGLSVMQGTITLRNHGGGGSVNLVKAGKVKKRSLAERASQLLSRRKMDSGLRLALPAPELVERPGPTFRIPSRRP